MDSSTEYHVTFGSNFTLDGFGYVRQGTITINSESVVLNGNKKLGPVYQVLFFIILIVPLIFLGGGLLGAVILLTLIHYFCSTRKSTTIPHESVYNVFRTNRIILFTGRETDTGIERKGCLVAKTAEDAANIESDLLT